MPGAGLGDGVPGARCQVPGARCQVLDASVGEGLDGQSPSIRTGYGGRLLYLVGYRDGSGEVRVRLLKEAIERVAGMVKE